MSKTNKDIVYVNHRTSAIPSVSVDGSSKTDSLINVIKNKTFIHNTVTPLTTQQYRK